MYHRVPFLRSKNFANGLKSKFKETIFTNLYLCLLFNLYNPRHNRISTNFWQNKYHGNPQPKSTKIAKFVALKIAGTLRYIHVPIATL